MLFTISSRPHFYSHLFHSCHADDLDMNLQTFPLSYMIHNPKRYGYAGAVALYIGWLSNATYYLDWGQEWQKYPIPTIAGLAVGNVVGALFYRFTGDKTITMD